MAIMDTIVTNVKDRLNELGVLITDDSVGKCFEDTIRELRIPLSSADGEILVGSELQFYTEVRTEYWAIHRIRNGQLLNFKYSTGTDGRSVDKTKIASNMTSVMEELGMIWDKWYESTYTKVTKPSTSGGTLTFARRTYTDLG